MVNDGASDWELCMKHERWINRNLKVFNKLKVATICPKPGAECPPASMPAGDRLDA